MPDREAASAPPSLAGGLTPAPLGGSHDLRSTIDRTVGRPGNRSMPGAGRERSVLRTRRRWVRGGAVDLRRPRPLAGGQCGAFEANLSGLHGRPGGRSAVPRVP